MKKKCILYIIDYGKPIRQIAITRHGKIKPALIITNDTKIDIGSLIRKYSRRWLIEKVISEQIEFFHMNYPAASCEVSMIEKTTLVILRLDRGIQRSRHWIARSSRAMTHFLLSHPDAEHRGILLIKQNVVIDGDKSGL